MNRGKKTITLILIVLFIHSLVYHEFSVPEDNITYIDLVNDDSAIDNPNNPSDQPINTDSDLPLKRDTIPGSFLLKGLFTHDSCVSLDQDGEVLELENYEDMQDLSILAQENRFQMYSNEPSTWPTTNDIYQLLSVVNEPFRNSSMFTSTFDYDTLIEGKVHFVTHIGTVIGQTQIYTFKISLFIYDPITYNTTEILNYEEVLPSGLVKGSQKIFNPQLNDTYLIPANNRLKLKFEGKVSDIEISAKVDLYSSSGGPQDYQWIINDGEYSNTYDFTKYGYILGMQIKYRSLKYPDIYVLGVENETYYSDPMNITINVVGGTQNSYRWDSDSFTSFNNTEYTSIPLTEEWHYLEIKALDEFNNTRISFYQIGYNPTETYLTLNNPLNNSVILESSLLNFSVSGYVNATFEWDNNGTKFDLLVVPDYNIDAHHAHGWHNLTFYISNYFVTEEKYYQFLVDALPPLIILNNVINNTLQPSNKLIEVKITDDSSSITVEYKWDDNIILPWSPSIGSIYKTYLPTAPGLHNLTVNAEDEYGHLDTKLFVFNSSEDALLIELRTMINESWHYGGNVVDVSLSGTNGTLLFKWDNGSFINGTPYIVDDLYLRLNGSYALSTDPTSYHYLSIVVGDITNLEYTYVFEFRIDRENPVIDSSIDDYNDERFTTSDVLPLIISDNATGFSDLLVLVSIDGYTNITLAYEYNLILNSLGDGVHNFRLYVMDIAGNYVTKYIVFYIDTQGPEIEIEIVELVTLLDGTDVTPYNSLVSISITDEDPIYNTYFSWDGSNFIQFTDTFNLNFPDGTGLLIIHVNDSLGNENQEIWSLAIDNLAPTVTLDFPFVNSTINAGTDIQLEVQEPNLLAVNLLIVYWDLYSDQNVSLNWDEFGVFRMPFLDTKYISGSIATIIIYAEDIVGNNHTYSFDFIVDKDAPETTIWYYDTEFEDYLPVIDGSVFHGNTTIWFNETSSDLLYFYVSWDNRGYEIINDPWITYIPVDDGEHLLDILLLDSTGEGTSPNIFQQLFTIIVDDIYIDYITPTELNDTEIPFIVEYKETFNFTVEIYDSIEGIDVTGLNSSVLMNELGLDISWINDSRTFQFSIFATNVTPLDTSFSTVVIEFSANGTNKHYIQVNLFVDRKDETTVTILEESMLSTTWEEDISVHFTLQEELDNYLEDIIRIEVNGTQILSFNNIGSNIIAFNYSSRNLGAKGFYTLNISIYSTYYRGQVYSDVEIAPLTLLFNLEVSSLEVVIDNQLVMTATLTYLNGTGLSLEEIKFTVYIYYQQEGVTALIEGYDEERSFSDTTNSTGHALYNFEMTKGIDHVRISATFEGNQYAEIKNIEFEDIISTISGGLSPYILYPLIGVSILVVLAAIIIGRRLSKTKPFEDYLEEVIEDEITKKLIGINPGAFLIIFDQRKGATPVVHDHDLDTVYSSRINLGSMNFILKISDQAFSSLGFEDVGDRRRIGTILLPNEKMIGFIQGIQIHIPSARGGFENLAIIVLVNEEYDNSLLGNQTYLYDTIDILEKNLKEQHPLVEIRQSLARIRRETTRIVLADLAQSEKNKKE